MQNDEPKGMHVLWVDWNTSLHPPEANLIFTGFPYAESATTELLPLSRNTNISWTVANQTYCRGHIDAGGTPHLCYHRNPLKETKQCTDCRVKESLNKCAYCKGFKCINSEMKAFCESPFVVYLAAYKDDFVKVGVARQDRWKRRIAYQGANMALKMAIVPSGQIARAIEYKIHEKLSIPDRVLDATRKSSRNTSFSAERMAILLKKYKEDIRQAFPEFAEYFVLNPEIYDLYTSYVAKTAGFTVREDCLMEIKKQQQVRVAGSILAVKGWFLILANRNTITVFDLQDVLGRVVYEGDLGRLPQQRTLLEFKNLNV